MGGAEYMINTWSLFFRICGSSLINGYPIFSQSYSDFEINTRSPAIVFGFLIVHRFIIANFTQENKGTWLVPY